MAAKQPGSQDPNGKDTHKKTTELLLQAQNKISNKLISEFNFIEEYPEDHTLFVNPKSELGFKLQFSDFLKLCEALEGRNDIKTIRFTQQSLRDLFQVDITKQQIDQLQIALAKTNVTVVEVIATDLEALSKAALPALINGVVVKLNNMDSVAKFYAVPFLNSNKNLVQLALLGANDTVYELLLRGPNGKKFVEVLQKSSIKTLKFQNFSSEQALPKLFEILKEIPQIRALGLKGSELGIRSSQLLDILKLLKSTKVDALNFADTNLEDYIPAGMKLGGQNEKKTPFKPIAPAKGKDSISSLLSSVKPKPSLLDLDSDEETDETPTTLVEQDFYKSDGVKKLEALGASLKHLIQLNLSNNNFGHKMKVQDKYIAELAPLAKGMHGGQVQSINLSQCNLGLLKASDFLAFFEGLLIGCPVVHLDLSNNNLGSQSLETLTQFANVLNKSKVIALDLTGNAIDDKLLQRIAQDLQARKKVVKEENANNTRWRI